MNSGTFGSVPFIPGYSISKPEPLSRYLPPIPDGIVSSWLSENVAPGSWILDPFGASPRLAIEAARAGYRILVTANNPITRFLLEILARPPRQDDLKAALAALAASYVGADRTEPHIRSLYNTSCAHCGQIVSADAFLWEHGNPSPYIRSYSCPNCGDMGEHPCTSLDIELAGRFSSSGLHKARALERVIAANDQDRIHVEQALSVYIPRALYALITIINKMEGLSISAAGQKCLSALLLYSFDQANAMWKVPGEKERRRQLNIPRHFKENNVWLALEEGVKLFGGEENLAVNPPLPVTFWPEEPANSGGICVYEGRLITLADSIKKIDIRSVCTAIPRTNQAFWTLSALWAGWLWGREAVGPFKSVLRRQRYDWAWHANALSSVFKQMATLLPPTTPIMGIIGETEPGFIGAAIVAAAVAGCRLESMGLRTDENQAQIIWKCGGNPELSKVSPLLAQVAIKFAKNYLDERAEPASYLNTITSAFMGVTQSWQSEANTMVGVKSEKVDTSIKTGSLGEQAEPTPSIIYSSVYNSAREALSYRSGFLRYKLQDLTSFDTASKNQVIQTTLFSLDNVRSTIEDDEVDNSEIIAAESELSSEKERPTRSSDVTESTLFWLRDPILKNRIPISDRYELCLLDYLINHPGCTIPELDTKVCEDFPGLFTPDLEFIRLCLESYAIPDPHDPHRWHLRPEDDPAERQADLEKANQFIIQIGERLDFICDKRITSFSKICLTWLDKNGFLDYWFYPSITAAIGEFVLSDEQPTMKGFIVIPGSRANLLVYKLRRDPRLSKAFDLLQGNWRFLKFRHLRSLAESTILDRDNLDQMLALDPITYSTPQLWLI